MKNDFKLFGIIALIAAIGFSAVSCGEKGGVVEITNGHTFSAQVHCYSSMPSTGKQQLSKTINSGKTAKWTFDEDDTIYISATFVNESGGFGGTYSDEIDLSGGETKTVTIKPQE